ncbi:hypothetical protein [Aeromonas caviae]|uniref:hypothetical protein n=1 Tax=Aeromonas caviae TaxID=648 RepID=UPI002B48D5DC|nr:hypothetical protein [Aeromonas caviae]
MSNYYLLIQHAVEKIPLIEYMKRLCYFIINPSIGGGTFSCRQQRIYSFLDLFNSLSLLVIIVSLIILCDRSFSEFKVILAFNPLFIVVAWVSNALVFSLTCSGLLTLAINSSNSSRKRELNVVFFNLFTHGLRCYAVYGILLGLPYIKVCGEIILNGYVDRNVLQGWPWLAYLFITLIILNIWLVVIPYCKYSDVFDNKMLNYIFVIFVILVSFYSLKLLPFDYSERLFDDRALCDLFKQGVIYKRLPEHLQNEAVNKIICQHQ